MSHPRYIRLLPTGWARPGTVVAGLLALLLGAGSAQAVDPVEELAKTLADSQVGLERFPAGLKFREEALKKRIDALRTLADLRRALLLTEWKDGGIAALEVDRAARAEVGERFQKGVEAIVARGSTTNKLAVARMLAEMGVSVRALVRIEKYFDKATNKERESFVQDQFGFGRSLTPALVRLTNEKVPAIRSAAAQALGKTNPAPDQGVAALKKMVESDSTEQRRAAAEAMLDMVREITKLQKRGQAQTGVEASPQDVIDVSKEVVSGARAGLTAPDVPVRRTSLATIRQAATTFGELIPEPYAPTKFPAPGRPWTEAERKAYLKEAGTVEGNLKMYAPMVQALAAEGKGIAPSLNHPDAQVRLETRRALEMIGNARQRLQRYVDSLPSPPGVAVTQASQKGKGDPLLEALQPALQEMARSLQDPRVEVRRAGVEFLETLGEDAKPAVPALAQALADRDRFVRWAAARTLGRIGTHRADLTVPGLASLVSDPDLEVSKEAADTLGGFGAEAKGAVPALIRATGVGDAEMRVKAITTLGTLGAEVASPAVPALIAALGHPDERVRREAARSLGKFGAAARPARDALRRALDDPDAEARAAASDALLSIPAEGKE
ncbi:MAG: HEAT repeat domain-containing protein [Gemmataceae bacterium]|nr:HEAT repeat domain-containing protein [Gemmataceae bacterium]